MSLANKAITNVIKRARVKHLEETGIDAPLGDIKGNTIRLYDANGRLANVYRFHEGRRGTYMTAPVNVTVKEVL
jgi:hypothetical protein